MEGDTVVCSIKIETVWCFFLCLSTERFMVSNIVHATQAAEALRMYEQLGRKGKPNLGSEWSVMAGLVLEEDGMFKTVALATGNKCLPAVVCASHDGWLLSDSHAEVLCRRSFHRFLCADAAVRI